MNIIDLLKEDGISPAKVASTHGAEYASKCPWCGGKDRFRAWPNQENGGNYWCRKCQKSGGMIRYLMEYRKMPYQDACVLIGRTPGPQKGETEIQKGWQPAPPQNPPPAKWQIEGERLIKWAEGCLWDPTYINIVKQINERGLNDMTIKKARLGWLTQDFFPLRETWGLPPIAREDRLTVKLRIPAGLIIPYFQNGRAQRIRVRLLYPESDRRYYILPGSNTNPMVLNGPAKGAIIVESDLDAILIHQEAGDSLTVISLGSAVMKPTAATYEILKQAEIVLVSLDGDEAGALNSKWWLGNFPNAKRWPVPKDYGKDPSEAFQKGLHIRDWVLAGITSFKPLKQSGSAFRSTELPSAPFTLISDKESLARYLSGIDTSMATGLNALTTGINPHTDEITHLLLSFSATPVIAVEMGKFKTREDLAPLIDILQGPCKKVLHDGKPIVKFLTRLGISPTNMFDTMLADQILTAGIDKKDPTLKALAKDYLGEPEIIGDLSLKAQDPALLGFWAYETALLHRLETVLSKNLEESNLSPTAILEFECLPAVAKMELNGMLVDVERLKIMDEKFLPVFERSETSLKKELGDINLNNQSDLQAALKARGIDMENTKRESLTPLLGQVPFLKDLIESRKASYSLSLIRNLIDHIHPVTGRIHPNYHQIGAPTGRMSCSDPNLQGIPRGEDFRSCFIASPGHKLIIADYSQIELRVAAEIFQDKRMIDAFQRGMDLHKLTASIITGKSIDQITKEDRQAAKAVNFGLLYAMGANGLREYARNIYGVNMTDQNVQTFIKKFFEAYSGIAKWHKSVQESASNESRTILGRRRIWAEKPKITELLNAPVQGTAADIIKKALSMLSEFLGSTEARIIGCVHDEIILETPIQSVEQLALTLRESMVKSGKQYLKQVPLQVQVEMTNTWANS